MLQQAKTVPLGTHKAASRDCWDGWDLRVVQRLGLRVWTVKGFGEEAGSKHFSIPNEVAGSIRSFVRKEGACRVA